MLFFISFFFFFDFYTRKTFIVSLSYIIANRIKKKINLLKLLEHIYVCLFLTSQYSFIDQTAAKN